MNAEDIRKLANISGHNSERGYEDDANAPVLLALADVVETGQRYREYGVMLNRNAFDAALARVEALQP